MSTDGTPPRQRTENDMTEDLWPADLPPRPALEWAPADDGHDEQCESEFISGPNAMSPCGCTSRGSALLAEPPAPNPLDGADDLPAAVRIQLRDRRDVVAVLREYGHTADEQHVAASVRAALRGLRPARTCGHTITKLIGEGTNVCVEPAGHGMPHRDDRGTVWEPALPAPVETPEQQP